MSKHAKRHRQRDRSSAMMASTSLRIESPSTRPWPVEVNAVEPERSARASFWRVILAGRERRTADPRRGRRARELARDAPMLALAAVLWVGALVGLWSIASNANGIDFYDYYTVSSSLGRPPVSEPREIYTPAVQHELGAKKAAEARAGGIRRQIYASKIFHPLQPTSSPYTYSLWRMVSWLPYNKAFLLVQGVSIAVFVTALFVLGRMFRLSWGFVAVLGLVLCIDSAPLASELRVCNVNRLLVAGMTLYLWLHGRAHAAQLIKQRRAELWQLGIGACMFCVTAFKPTVGPMFGVAWLWSLGSGKPRNALLQVAGAGLGALLCVAIAAPVFGGLGAWVQWLGSITTTLSDARTTVTQGNYAPARILEAVWPGQPWRYYGVYLSLALLGGLGLRLLARERPLRPVRVLTHVRHHAVLLGLGFAVVLCTSRLTWLHWQLLLTPAIIALAPTRVERLPAWLGGAVPWVCGVACFCLHGLAYTFLARTPLRTATMILVADAIFLVLCVTAVWRAASTRPRGAVAGEPRADLA